MNDFCVSVFVKMVKYSFQTVAYSKQLTKPLRFLLSQSSLALVSLRKSVVFYGLLRKFLISFRLEK